MFDEILESFGIKYEDLNSVEKDTFSKWLKDVEETQITLGDVYNNIKAMRISVENELANYETTNKKDLYLKARLKNYILLEAFLETPQKAKHALEKHLGRLSGK